MREKGGRGGGREKRSQHRSLCVCVCVCGCKFMCVFSDALPADLNKALLHYVQGKLLGVCGSVGSGKSSLIHAILGRVSD